MAFSRSTERNAQTLPATASLVGQSSKLQDERTGEMKKTAECRTEHKDPLERQMELCRIPGYPLNATRALTSGSSLPVRSLPSTTLTIGPCDVDDD